MKTGTRQAARRLAGGDALPPPYSAARPAGLHSTSRWRCPSIDGGRRVVGRAACAEGQTHRGVRGSVHAASSSGRGVSFDTPDAPRRMEGWCFGRCEFSRGAISLSAQSIVIMVIACRWTRPCSSAWRAGQAAADPRVRHVCKHFGHGGHGGHTAATAPAHTNRRPRTLCHRHRARR